MNSELQGNSLNLPIKLDTLTSYQNVCRTCLLSATELTNVHDVVFDQIRLVNTLEQHLFIKIDELDQLPQVLCRECISEVYRIQNFITKCQWSENKLKSFIKIKCETDKFDSDILQSSLTYELLIPDCEIKTEEVDNSEEPSHLSVIIKTEPITEESEQQTDYGLIEQVVNLEIEPSEKSHLNQKYSCNKCDKKYDTVSRLAKHMVLHMDPKFECSECDKKFHYKRNFELHIIQHGGIRPYKCSDCEKSFRHPSGLKKHLRVHTGEKQFVCSVCTKKFTSSGALTAHMRRHTGEKPYICSYCDKRFTTKGDLTTHSRLHTGERPYVCDICTRAFCSSTNLRKHKNSCIFKNT